MRCIIARNCSSGIAICIRGAIQTFTTAHKPKINFCIAAV